MEYVSSVQSEEIVLREKLKAKFANRGIAAIPSIYKDRVPEDVQELIRERINPFEAEEVASKEKALNYSEVRREQKELSRQYVVTETATREIAYTNVNQTEWDGSYKKAYDRAANIREMSSQARIDRQRIDALAASAKGTTFAKNTVITNAGEKKKSSISLELVMLLTICTIALMFVIFTISQIYSYESQIKSLERQYSDLIEAEQGLQMELNEKNDLALIEQIAINDYGMVKNDSIDKNYVSLASSDRVEIVQSNAEGTGFFASLLSAFFGNN